ncbi:MAG: MerC domain-containing protein [Chloroherpetonaceae bacterium]|nr:MerC domain-containing protein [Chloroherpetonaceae bacterium]
MNQGEERPHHPNSFLGLNLDKIGFSASMICAIHCLFVPLFLAGATGFSVLAHPVIEFSIISFGIIVGVSSLSHSFRFHHKNALPILLIVLGFGIIASGHLFFDEFESIVTPIGAIIVASSHMINFKLTKSCPVGS